MFEGVDRVNKIFSFSLNFSRFIIAGHMFGQIQYFQKGKVYRIRNRKTGRHLSVTPQDLTTSPLEQSIDQLWLVSEIKSDEFEIKQMRTGQVITLVEGKEAKLQIKMQKRKMKSSQYWILQRAQIVNDQSFFWMRPIKNDNYVLAGSSMSEKIKISQIDQTLQICLWQFVNCPANDIVFNGLSIIRSEVNKFVLEVPEYSTKEGTNIVQYDYNGNGSQRWIIQAYQHQNTGSKEFTIKSVCSGLFLTATFSKLGFKLTQSIFNCGPDQRWKLIRVKQNIFLLQSISNENYYLGVNNDKGGSTVTMTQELEKIKWIIEGYYPAV